MGKANRAQGSGNIEQTQPTRDLSALVPAPNAVDDTRVRNALKDTAEESDDVDVLDVFGIRSQESQDSPENLEGGDQDVGSVKEVLVFAQHVVVLGRGFFFLS